jgi:hypothetical protein
MAESLYKRALAIYEKTQAVGTLGAPVTFSMAPTRSR